MTALRRGALAAALVLAGHFALPAAACVEPAVMACCVEEGSCECPPADAAFARCDAQDASPAPAAVFLATLTSPPAFDRAEPSVRFAPGIALRWERLLPPPPTPPPRFGRA